MFDEAAAIDQAVTSCAEQYMAEHPNAWCDATLDDLFAAVDEVLAGPDDVGKRIMAAALFEVWRRIHQEAEKVL